MSEQRKESIVCRYILVKVMLILGVALATTGGLVRAPWLR